MCTGGAHILVYPLPAPGHIIPILDLTHLLLTRGLTITVLVTPNNLHLLDPLLSCYAASQMHYLVLPSSQNSKGPLVNMRSLCELHYPILLNWFQSHTSPPVAIISDFFLGWTHKLACEVGVQRVVFSTTSSFAFSVTTSLWREQPRNEDPKDMEFLVSFPKIPKSPSYPWWQISHLYRASKEGDPDWEFFRDSFSANLASWGIVFNSFAELERVYFEHIKDQLENNQVWAVGPVLPLGDDLNLIGPTNRGGSSSVPCHDVLTWLDSRKDDSVIYICFGSRVMLTRKQMNELVGALEKSGVHFICCVRQPSRGHASDDYGILPDGFEDRVAGRGYVIRGWAPQVAILNHRSVGAFLTHCGWNSMLEGIASGVVMLTWPMGADQFINAQLVVDQVGVGIRVGEHTEKIPESTELARIHTESLEENRPERIKSKELREAVLDAVKGGSSNKDLDELVKRLNELKSVGSVVTK